LLCSLAHNKSSVGECSGFSYANTVYSSIKKKKQSELNKAKIWQDFLVDSCRYGWEMDVKRLRAGICSIHDMLLYTVQQNIG